MDLDALRMFVKVAELSSFTRAAEQRGVAKAKASLQVKELEGELGTRLFQRSTRVVRLTAEGELLLGRASRLLADAEEIGTMFQAARAIRGSVRVDFPVTIARKVILPQLAELLARHPELRVTVSATDRRVEALREGFDCVLRGGDAVDPGLVGRRLGALRTMTCASPGYLRRHGIPTALGDLERHVVVHYSSTLGNEPPSFEHVGGEVPMKSLVTVNNVEAYHAAAIADLGLIQVPRVGVQEDLAAGRLVEVLPGVATAPMPVSLLHTHGRNAPRRVRAVMTWIVEVVTPYIVRDR